MNDPLHLPVDAEFLVSMVESLDAGLTIVDPQGRFVVWNEACTRILGKGPALQVEPRDWPRFYGLHCPLEQRLLEFEELPLVKAMNLREHIEQELILLHEDLPEARWIRVIARPVLSATQEFQGAVAVIRDVTREKASLMASQMMSWFFSASEDAILGLNLEGIVQIWNPGASELLGWTAEEIIGKSLLTLVPENRHGEVHALVERARNNLPLPSREVELLHRQGHLVPVLRSITVMRESRGNPIGAVVVVRDISKLRTTERQLEESRRQLRLLSARQQSLLEQQLRALARELHDEFGQQLAAMKFELAWLERHVSHLPKVEERLESLNQVLDSTIAGLRRISKQMRPPLLEELGLCHAVDELITGLKSRYPLQASYQCSCHHLNFNPEAALALYRIIQEALTNVVRHSQATRVDIHLTQVDQSIQLSVRDDGKGLCDQPSQGLNFGILGMQERALSWSGRVQVANHPQGGVEVSAEFPLEQMLLLPRT